MKMIGYLSLGYPTLEKSIEMADIYTEHGCDAVEISIPGPNPCYEKLDAGGLSAEFGL